MTTMAILYLISNEKYTFIFQFLSLHDKRKANEYHLPFHLIDIVLGMLLVVGLVENLKFALPLHHF